MTDATAHMTGDLGSSVAAPGSTAPGSTAPGAPEPSSPNSNPPAPSTPSPSEPESAAIDTHIGAVVYFSSASENTA